MQKALTVVFLALAALTARAQIFSHGADPARLKWYSIESPSYKVIYPEGTDSLARRYAVLLERYRVPIGRSIGMTPGSLQWNKTPVVLHAYYGYSNGSMFWAPNRMDLFTRMEPYGADPAPWDMQLAAHEPRHQAQLQAGFRGPWKPLNYLLGELWPAAVWSLYPSQALSEGDAVAVETAITGGARTRTADFLNYFRVAFDEGDKRNWYRWRYGSYRHYTPDYYKVGYMTVAGLRVFYDRPLFMKEYFDHVTTHPFSVGNMQKMARRASGKPFKDTFADIMDRFHGIWLEEASARAPFMPMEQLTEAGRFPVDYSSPLLLDGVLYALKSGYAQNPVLVKIEKGRETRLRPFSGSVSALVYSAPLRRLFWSETVGDRRWELSHTSRIRSLDLETGACTDLTREGRLYNPQPGPDGLTLIAVEYPYNGGGAVIVLDARDGRILRRVPAPDGIQPTESAALGADLYVAGLAEGGYGIYRIGPEGSWNTVFDPVVAKVEKVACDKDGVEWVSDRDGERELYRYTPADGKLVRRTATRYGVKDYSFQDGFLYFCAQTRDGMMLFRTPEEDLPSCEVSYSDVHSYPVEEALTAQEKALAGDGPFIDPAEPEISAPQRYRKLPHLVHFHSWAPLYFNYDAVSSLSMDLSYETASPGVTGLFQNDLGTVSGFVGYGLHRDPDEDSHWRNSFHGKITCTGRFPVIEASFDVGDRNARQYTLVHYLQNGKSYGLGTLGNRTDRPLATGVLSVYVPLRFNKGGVLAGAIPRLNYSLSNSAYNTAALRMDRIVSQPGTLYVFDGQDDGQNRFMQSVSASVRGYVMLPTAPSQVYPHLGVGAEGGFRLRPGLTKVYAPNVYGYLYGYLPGIGKTQGLRLTGMVQHQFRRGQDLIFGEQYANIVPRGFPAGTGAKVASQHGTQWKVTADYALPVYVGDISLFSPVAYIKNFLLVPQVDYTGFREGSLVSVGADITAELANLLWFPFDCSVGVSVHWLAGTWFSQAASRPVSAELVFSMDI